MLFFLSISISVLLASSAQAALVPISDLQGGQLEYEDKLFSEFDVTGISDGGPPEPSAATVEVMGTTMMGDHGLWIRLAWNSGVDQLINAQINFKVSILPDYDPWFIEDAMLLIPSAGATDDGLVTVTEAIYATEIPINPLAMLDCKREGGDGGVNLDDSSYFEGGAQLKEIWVRMGITVRGGYSPDPGTGSLTEIFVLYSQIPEPTTILLLGLGSLALLRIRKR
jgi:hypothetical protein